MAKAKQSRRLARTTTSRPKKTKQHHFWRFYTGLAIVCLFIGVGAIGVQAAWRYVHTPEHFPIRHVQVTGHLQHLSSTDIMAKIRPDLAEGFFALPVTALTERLQTLPWVKSVIVHRRWPDRLQVAITEQTVAALWDQTQLVNGEGKIFASTVPEQEPVAVRLQGPPGSLPEVWAHYQQLQAMLLAEKLPALKSLSLSSSGCWTVYIAGLQIVLGSEATWAQNMQRLGLILPQLTRSLGKVQHIDLRYPLGVAVS